MVGTELSRADTRGCGPGIGTPGDLRSKQGINEWGEGETVQRCVIRLSLHRNHGS